MLKVLQDAPLGASCNTFDLHWMKIGLENPYSVFLREAVLHRFYCTCKLFKNILNDVQTKGNGGDNYGLT